jgi:integrase
MSIKKLDTGYEVRYDAYDAAGIRHQYKKHCDKAADARALDAAHTLNKQNESKITVKEYLDGWLEHVKLRRKPKTHETYDYAVNHYFLPHFDGRMKLAKVKSIHLQKVFDAMIAGGLGASTVSIVRRTLHAAFGRTVGECITVNPITRTEGGGKAPRTHTAIDAGQAEGLLAVLEGNDFYWPVFLAVTLALGRAECAGLEWRDIDLQKKTLTVERNRLYFKKQGVLTGTPKTENRRRTLELPLFVVEKLRRLKKQQLADKVLFGNIYKKSDYVCRRRDGSTIHPNHYSDAMMAAYKAAALPKITFHDLRHSCASVLIARGVPITVVSAILGHSSPQITMQIYAHALQSGKREAADMLDKIYGKK